MEAFAVGTFRTLLELGLFALAIGGTLFTFLTEDETTCDGAAFPLWKFF